MPTTAAIHPAPSRATAAGSSWVRSPMWDLFWLHGGLWLAPLAVVASYGWPSGDDSPAGLVYLLLSALFWIGHRFSSTWLAWLSTAYGPARKAQPLRFYVVPGVVVALTALVVLAPDAWLPGTWLERVWVLAGVDYLLVTWHFAAQHFGVLSLYRSRDGRSRDTRTRTLDRWFAVGVGGVLIMVAELSQGASTVPDTWLGPLADASFLATWAPAARLSAATVAGAATLGLLFREHRHQAGPGRLLYVAGLGVMVLCATLSDPFVFIFCWTAQHWMAAVGLAAVVTEGEPSPERPNVLQRLLHAVHRVPGRWILVLALLSALTMPLYEVESSGGPDDRPAFEVLNAALDGILTAPLSLQLLTALGLSTAFLHYLLDRAAWRFSDPLVRQAAAPLLRPHSG